jgi:hypothetical protein
MVSARERALATSELLEAILLQLTPLNNLLLAQLVSSRWRDAIASSPRLQEKLFLRAAPTSRQEWKANPLLRQHFLPFFVMPTERFSCSMPSYDSLQVLNWMQTSKRDAFLREKASWREMLFVQPSPRELHVVQVSHGQGGDYEEKSVVGVEDGEGVTMGLIYDITESFVRGERISSFGLTLANIDTDGNKAPRMSLFLMYTQQCCVGLPPKDDYMKSCGAAWDIESVEWVESRIEEYVGIDMERSTDLTPEKGGVDQEIWEAWMREREELLEGVSEKIKRRRENRKARKEREKDEEKGERPTYKYTMLTRSQQRTSLR